MESYYRDTDCPNCGRLRVEFNGVCEKCLWDMDGGDYACITRPTEYDTQGWIVVLPENDILKDIRERDTK